MTTDNETDRRIHPDLDLLARLVAARDEQSSHGRTLPELVSPIVDEESLFFIAQQRVRRAIGSDAPPALTARVMTIFYDGFLLGHEIGTRNS